MKSSSILVRGLAVLGLSLVGGASFAHVGQTAPAKWLLRLEQKSSVGKPSTTKTYAWKVPLATFNKRYDDGIESPLAQLITDKAPTNSGFTPLWLTVPATQHAVCMRGATLEFTSDTTGVLCDSTGALAGSAGVPKQTQDNNWRNSLFNLNSYRAASNRCVNVNITKGGSCSTPSYGSYYDPYSGYYDPSIDYGMGVGWYFDGASQSWVQAVPTNTDSACTVTISGPGIGDQVVPVSGSWVGSVVSLGDLWYYGKTSTVNGRPFCQEGLAGQSCGSAGTPKCAYYGVEDGVSKGITLPMDRESIVAGSRNGMGLLKSQAYGWMRGAMQREQLMNGYFTHILTDVKLLKSQNNTREVTQWTTENAEVQWTVYMDNTPADAADKPGRNTPASYGDVLIRREEGHPDTVGSGSILLCRYQSHTSEFLPKEWTFPKTGYLTCSSWKPPSAAEAAAGNLTGQMLNANIFLDPTNPDTQFGLNLNNGYDDRSNDDPVQCALAPDLCISPFEAGGGGDRLIKEVILPLVSKYDAQNAILNYVGAPSFTLLNRQAYSLSGGTFYVNTASGMDGSTTPRLIQYFDTADWSDPGKLKAGQSFFITGRSVNFPNCGVGTITMSQNWVWDAQNAVPELNWDAWRVLISPMGPYQVMQQVNTGDGSVPEGNGLPATAAANANSTRSGVAIPFSVAVMVPAAWRSTMDYYWNDKVYYPGDLTGDLGMPLPAVATPWRKLFYPEVTFPVPPGPDKFDGPYFVLDPMAYPGNHPGYSTVFDAHLYDGRDPLNAPKLADSLNHTFRSAPQNGTVSGNIEQTRRRLICDTKGTSQCCTKWETKKTPEVCKDGVCTGGETYSECMEYGQPYETCSSYHCEAYYCDWGANEARPGTWELGAKEFSCSGWEYLEQLKQAYAANKCVLPHNFNHLLEDPQYGNSLNSYIQWKENGIRANNRIQGVGSSSP